MNSNSSNNTVWYVLGVIVLVIIIGAVVWLANGNSGTGSPYGTTASTTMTDEATTTTADSAPVATAAYTATRVPSGNTFVTTITYNGTSFSPSIVEVHRGESVKFVNNSSTSMRVVSDQYESVPLYAGLDEDKSVGKGGTFTLNFTEDGVWGYNNLDGAAAGIVYVVN